MDNLSTVDKLPGPNVSFIERFYCIYFGVIIGLYNIKAMIIPTPKLNYQDDENLTTNLDMTTSTCQNSQWLKAPQSKQVTLIP